ncbi:MAG: YgeY family selenium metabolism-linked hydrolase [Candidatus Heimdallarchaeota archaeon]
MKGKINKFVESSKKEIVSLLQKLIQIPSTTGNEGEIIQFLEKEMKAIGFDEVYVDQMGNLIGKIGNGPRILAIDGHVDTVEIGKQEYWKFDPLKGIEQNENIYGRGACDQKGGIASALMAVKILKKIGIPDLLTIYFVASVHEEPYEGANWQFILENSEMHPNAVLLTEPSNLSISIGQRGRIDIKIKVKGLSSHGAEPDIGINAIFKMNPIIAELEEFHKNMPIDPIFGKGSLTITEIKSTSVSLNAVADSCTIHIDRRLGSEETLDKVIDEIRNLKSVIDAEAEVFVPEYEVKSYKNHSYGIIGFYPCWIMDKSHRLVQSAKSAFEYQFGKQPQIGTWRFSTNGVATKGRNDIPTIGFGPGEEKLAHTYEEHVPIEHLLKASEFYIAFMLEYAK